tara:strand:+ start:1528 stop:2172 length:645 start_codon:yes stop_codon:yes gene_type:complete
MATSNAATTYLENKILDFLFKNNSSSFATPGNDIYIGLATAVSDAEAGTLTEVSTVTQDANYTRQQVNASNWTLASSSTDQQTVTNAANIEFSASSGIASYTVTHTFVTDKNFATAVVNGAVSSSANVTVDGNSGTIAVGDVVTGTGIGAGITVATVNSQTSIVLSSAVSVSDNVVLKFDGGNKLFVGAVDTSKQIDSGDIFRINATNFTIELK